MTFRTQTRQALVGTNQWATRRPASCCRLIIDVSPLLARREWKGLTRLRRFQFVHDQWVDSESVLESLTISLHMTVARPPETGERTFAGVEPAACLLNRRPVEMADSGGQRR